MQEITVSDGVAAVVQSILTDRLVLIAGAGLSMAPPSSLPSAASIASDAKSRYDAMFGSTRPPLPTGIAEQAEFFFQRGELATFFFRKLIDQNAFAGEPNAGHYAAADLLLVRAIQTCVTTNVDVLVETAGQYLFGQVGVGIDAATVARLPPDTAPLLKVHGCRVSDPDNMVWAPGQLDAPPVNERIARSAQWLYGRLLDRDILIVGYSTDWDYLNKVLEETLGTIRPSRVIVVDLADRVIFAQKAPELHALGLRASSSFNLVRTSGAAFLEKVREEFSRSFLRRVLHNGATDYAAKVGHPADVGWLEPPLLDNDTLWQVRRDMEGRSPREPAQDRDPENDVLLGLTLLELQALGAVADGPYWSLHGRRIRVLRASGKLLHRVEANFAGQMAPAIAPDLVIAVGAEPQALPGNIARTTANPTIARGSISRWLTRPEAIAELSL